MDSRTDTSTAATRAPEIMRTHRHLSGSMVLLIVIGISIPTFTMLLLLNREAAHQQREGALRFELQMLKRKQEVTSSAAKKQREEYETGSVPNTPNATHTSSSINKVEFLGVSNNLLDLTDKDWFSASWWQKKERFMEFPPELVHIVEDDVFKPVLRAGRGQQDVRMTLDWLEFSVEHLSKWWKIAQEPAMHFAIGKLQTYIQNVLLQRQRSVSGGHHSAAMGNTLAIIPLGVNSDDGTTKQVWMTSLAATIASLLKHGVGRVVVVGHYRQDAELTRKAFWYLRRHLQHVSKEEAYDATATDFEAELVVGTGSGIEKTPFSTQYGATELAYVYTGDVKTKFIEANIPHGALKGLQRAFSAPTDSPDWLGPNPDKYKYVFLTEGDQILNARLEDISSFQSALDEGRIIIPHRLQPIPHRLDLDLILDNPEVQIITGLSEKYEHVNDLDSDTDSCCDSGVRLTTEDKARYGMRGFWWQHGFNRKNNFKYLQEFQFMRLIQGTGIVHVAAKEHSRKCLPAINKKSCR